MRFYNFLWWILLNILNRLVPGLKSMPVPVLVTLKFRYTNRKAPAQQPFLLAGELASPVGRVLVVLGWLLGRFTCKIWVRELSWYYTFSIAEISYNNIQFSKPIDYIFKSKRRYFRLYSTLCKKSHSRYIVIPISFVRRQFREKIAEFLLSY